MDPVLVAEFTRRAEEHEGGDGCWLWEDRIDAQGYGRLSFQGKQGAVHRLSCLVFHGPPPVEGLHALHHCDVKPCWRPDHLYWGTPADNTRDALERGRIKFGMDRQGTKLTDEQVREVYRHYHEGVGLAEIAERYSVSIATVCAIGKRRARQRALASVPPAPTESVARSTGSPGERHPMAKATEDAVREIRELYALGITRRELRERFGLSKSQIQRIVTGEAWTHAG